VAFYVGLISGTSIDAIDCALVDFDRSRPEIVATRAHAMPDSLRETLLRLADDPAPTLGEVAIADVELGRQLADSVLTLLSQAKVPPSEVRAIGSHGQTIRHCPDGAFPYSVQIGDPNIVAETTRITTVADFRRRDLAAGGQGAPLVPAFHHVVFNEVGRGQVVVNLGGIANITILPPARDRSIGGFDSGPGNVLLDSWARRHLGTRMDEDGRWTCSGKMDNALQELLLSDDYLSRPPPKSTGREHFNIRWLEKHLVRLGGSIGPEDVQRTLTEFTARTVADSIQSYAGEVSEILVCGGGANNPFLMDRLARSVEPSVVISTAARGVPPDWVEAIAFAWFARRTLQGLPGNVPRVTGARRPVVIGGIYPGDGIRRDMAD